jgi:adenylate kinase
MIIIMLGAPGTGKGTVGGLLSKQLGIVHISSGEIFRSYVKKHRVLGKKIESYLLNGQLVPDELAIELIEKRLQEEDTKNGMILDGYPRNINQAIQLNQLFEKQGKKVDVAVNLDLPDNEIVDRIVKRRTCPNTECREIYNLDFKPPIESGVCDKCGSPLIQRSDDNEETVKQRLETYHRISENLIQFYKSQDILYTLKLNNKSDVTTMNIAEEVKNYIDSH